RAQPDDRGHSLEVRGREGEDRRAGGSRRSERHRASAQLRRGDDLRRPADGSVVALNAKTGAPVWTVDTTGAGTTGQGNVFGETNPPTTYFNAGGTGLVLAAPNGGDQPLRGHLDAYEAKSGKLVWRTWTTPDPTQLPFILSWGNPAQSATGGSAVWSLPTVDPQLGTVYFGTGNAFPYNGRAPGKNLWTESLMAVNSKSGVLKWYFQTTHHDEWDYDDPNPPVRVNVN